MSSGAQLRSAREARGLSLEALSRLTRVQPRILAAIEEDDIRAVPPRPFGRGFVASYAREVGLDPEPLARDYFARFAPAAPPAPPPALSDAPEDRRVLPLALAGAVALFAILGVAAVLRTASSSADGDPVSGALGTSGSPAPGSASAPAPASAPALAPAAEPADPDPRPASVMTPAARQAAPDPAEAAATPAPVTIVVRATTRRAWVAARADGKRVVYQMLMPGEERTITATEAVSLRVGDAGALQWRINGRDAGAMGRSGQVRDLRITPATAERVR